MIEYQPVTMVRKGFTLIELLVVISIIALLLSILMPVLNKAKMRAYDVVCLANLKALWHGWVMYTDDNDGKLVGGHVGSNDWVDEPGFGGGDAVKREKDGIRKGRLYSYVQEVGVYHCRLDKRAKRGRGGYRSYSIAGGMNGEAGEHIFRQLTEIKPLSRYYVFVEEADPREFNMGSWLINTDTELWIDPLTVWHGKSSTLGFADGHAEVHKWVDLSTWQMSAFGLFYFHVYPEDSGDDFNFMQHHYAHRPFVSTQRN